MEGQISLKQPFLSFQIGFTKETLNTKNNKRSKGLNNYLNGQGCTFINQRWCQSLSSLHFDNKFVATLPSTVFTYQQINILFSLARQKYTTDFRSALRQFEFLEQLTLVIKESQASILRKGSELKEGSYQYVVIGGGDGCGSKSAIELMEEAKYCNKYLMQYIPSFDSQNRKMRFFPVSETQMIRSSWLNVNPVGALKHRRAIERILCCCISITKRLPLLLAETFSPKAPQSVKKILPVLFERTSE